MLGELSGYDWAKVFEVCGPPVRDEGGDYTPSPDNEPDIRATDGFKREMDQLGYAGPGLAEFTREDVVSIVGMADGEKDGPSWMGLFRLRDGRVAYVEAGCDYTGWD
jgi:hypothetical protein